MEAPTTHYCTIKHKINWTHIFGIIRTHIIAIVVVIETMCGKFIDISFWRYCPPLFEFEIHGLMCLTVMCSVT